mgnify:CR=1 FL=1
MKRPVIPIHEVSADAAADTRFVAMYQKAPDIYPRAVKGWFAGLFGRRA